MTPVTLETDMRDLIRDAVADGISGLPVVVELDWSAKFDLDRQPQGTVVCYLVPVSTNGDPADLGDTYTETFEMRVVIAKKLATQDSQEIDELVKLCRTVWNLASGVVTSSMPCLIFQSRTANPLHDADEIRNKRAFFSESLFTWSLIQ